VDFLKKELASKEFKKAEKRILIHHIPLYGNDYKNLCEDLWKPLLKKSSFQRQPECTYPRICLSSERKTG
jgi:hypothetical protein